MQLDAAGWQLDRKPSRMVELVRFRLYGVIRNEPHVASVTPILRMTTTLDV
jgi:hypothetical protein